MGRGKKTPAKGSSGPQEDDDEDEEVEGVASAVSGVKLEEKSDKNSPFNFGKGGAGPSGFNFGTQGATAPSFSFNFPASDSKAVVPAGGDENDEEEEEEDDEDPVEAFLKSLPESQQECVKALETLDEDVEKIQVEFRKEYRALQRKYEGLEAATFATRAAIISGEKAPENAEKADGTGIPDFWLQAMRNCSCIAESITEKDEVVLKALTNITAATLPEEEGVGFKLEFFFKENEHFTNKSLVKTYFMADGDDDPVLEKAEGTEINWAAGKNITVKIKKKKQRNKNGKGTRTVTKTEPCESFFNFFSPPKIPGADEAEVDEEEAERRHHELQVLEADYDMGITFREKLVPHAVKWFTGEADDDDEDYEEGEEDFEEEDFGEDEEEDEDDDPPPKGRGGRSGGGGAGRGRGRGRGGEECKQQ